MMFGHEMWREWTVDVTPKTCLAFCLLMLGVASTAAAQVVGDEPNSPQGRFQEEDRFTTLKDAVVSELKARGLEFPKNASLRIVTSVPSPEGGEFLVASIQLGWAKLWQRVKISSRLQSPSAIASALEENALLSSDLVTLNPVPLSEVNRVLSEDCSPSLAVVITEPQPPHFANEGNIKWDPTEKRLLLEAWGELDFQANRCAHAVVDIVVGRVLYCNVEAPCRVD